MRSAGHFTAADMAKLCGLEPKEGADTIRRWEVTGPSGRPTSFCISLRWPAITIPFWRISISSIAGTFDEKERPRGERPSAKKCATKFANASPEQRLQPFPTSSRKCRAIRWCD